MFMGSVIEEVRLGVLLLNSLLVYKPCLAIKHGISRSRQGIFSLPSDHVLGNIFQGGLNAGDRPNLLSKYGCQL